MTLLYKKELIQDMTTLMTVINKKVDYKNVWSNKRIILSKSFVKEVILLLYKKYLIRDRKKLMTVIHEKVGYKNVWSYKDLQMLILEL